MIHTDPGIESQITLDFRIKKPITEQIYAQLFRLIQENKIHPGEQLPPVRDLAGRLKVNFNTVARAYRQLDREGLISTQQGRGTYVLEPIQQLNEIKSFAKEDFLSRLDTFIQGEAQRSGQTENYLWDLLSAERAILVSGVTKRKPGRKITHKPGWKSFSIQFNDEPRKQKTNKHTSPK